jgi:hypothetical protein
MAKKQTIDPADGLVVSEVGEWAPEKHVRVQRYIEIASKARAMYVPRPLGAAVQATLNFFPVPADRSSGAPSAS